MSRITSYARQQNHGVSDPLSGATLPISNDHTDGSWTITDIYDREIMINTGNGNLQYRAGSDIYTVSSSPTLTGVKSITFPLGAWDMSTVAATDFIAISLGIDLVTKTFLGIDAMIYADGSPSVYANKKFKYSFTQATKSSSLQLYIEQDGVTPPSVIIGIDITPPAGTSNFFRFFLDSIDATFTDTAINRGYIIVTYID